MREIRSVHFVSIPLLFLASLFFCQTAHALLVLADGNDADSLVDFGFQVLGGNRHSGVQYDLGSDTVGWLPEDDTIAGGHAVVLSDLLSGTTLDFRCDTDTDPPVVWESLQTATVSDVQDRDDDGYDDYARFSWTTSYDSTITVILDMKASGGDFDRLVIPEPVASWLLGFGLLGLSAARRTPRHREASRKPGG
jgi:hypothetical protein